jgi:hypothetical protein
MRPFPAAFRADMALVELGSNGIVARCPGAHNLLNDRANIGGAPRIGLGNGPFEAPRGIARISSA